MDIDIRQYIKQNFKGADIDEIKDSICSSIKEKEEVTLPGLGVFFEILWTHSDSSLQNEILQIIQDNMKG